LVRIVAGIGDAAGGPPGISGLSDDSRVSLGGVEISTAGGPIPACPEQPAIRNNTKAILAHDGMIRILRS
jgi:hypothetical protein